MSLDPEVQVMFEILRKIVKEGTVRIRKPIKNIVVQEKFTGSIEVHLSEGGIGKVIKHETIK